MSYKTMALLPGDATPRFIARYVGEDKAERRAQTIMRLYGGRAWVERDWFTQNADGRRVPAVPR